MASFEFECEARTIVRCFVEVVCSMGAEKRQREKESQRFWIMIVICDGFLAKQTEKTK